MRYSFTQVRRRTLLFILLSCMAFPALAQAHGGNTGPVRTVTQAVGPYELSVMLELPSVAPATVFIDITPQQPVDGARFALRAAPRGQAFAGRPVAEVSGLPGPPTTYLTQLDVERAGDWDVEIVATGPNGTGRAVIPFTLVVAPIPPLSWALFGALGALAALLAGSIAASAVFRERGVPPWLGRALSYGTVAALTTAAVVGALEALGTTQAPVAPGVRPHVNVALQTTPAAPLAGQPVQIDLTLTDGATGLPADDLEPHHEALVHLIILDEKNNVMQHVHPARIGPGRFQIALTLTQPGRYTAYAEVQRQDSGAQVIGRDFTVAGTALADDGAPPGFGVQTFGAVRVESSTGGALRAGQAATLSFALSDADGPLRDVEPWLGMAGHLIGRSADGQVFIHAHAAEAMPPPGPAGLGTRYGPVIRFVYAFPEPGEYRLWAQFKRAGTVLTVPLTVQVGAG